MNKRRATEIRVSWWLFWRYAWRMWLFAGITFALDAAIVRYVIVHGRYTPAQVPLVDDWGGLAFLCLSLFYGVALWFGQRILRPVKIEGTMCDVRVSSPSSSAWKRALALWWGFNWRSSLLFVVASTVSGTIFPKPPLAVFSLAILLFVCGVFSMWWMVFHPYGRTHVLITSGGECHDEAC